MVPLAAERNRSLEIILSECSSCTVSRPADNDCAGPCRVATTSPATAEHPRAGMQVARCSTRNHTNDCASPAVRRRATTHCRDAILLRAPQRPAAEGHGHSLRKRFDQDIAVGRQSAPVPHFRSSAVTSLSDLMGCIVGKALTDQTLQGLRRLALHRSSSPCRRRSAFGPARPERRHRPDAAVAFRQRSICHDQRRGCPLLPA